MEFSNLDMMLKYQILQNEAERSYKGIPQKYIDGRSLDIFPEKDLVNNCNPLFVFGTVVYLVYGENVLMLKPMKENRVVDTLTGLGGKVKALVNGKALNEEKADINRILSGYVFRSLDTAEKLRIAAAREVMEETGTYSRDEKGSFTHSMTKEGIKINPVQLKDIGVSRIRITGKSKTESWLVQNYAYELSYEEYLFIEENVAKENREGILKWYSKDEVYPYMSYADQMVLRLYDGSSVISEIRDMINEQNIFRTLVKGDEPEVITYINGEKVYSNSIRLEDVKIYFSQVDEGKNLV